MLLGAIAFAAPTANAYFTTHQLMLTPDSHRGRVVSVAAVASGGGGAVAPLAGGIVLDLAGRSAGLLGCTAVMAVIALLTSLSPALRDVPEPGTAGTAPRHGPHRRTRPAPARDPIDASARPRHRRRHSARPGARLRPRPPTPGPDPGPRRADTTGRGTGRPGANGRGAPPSVR